MAYRDSSGSRKFFKDLSGLIRLYNILSSYDEASGSGSPGKSQRKASETKERWESYGVWLSL